MSGQLKIEDVVNEISKLGYDYVPGDLVMTPSNVGLFIGQEDGGGIVWVLFNDGSLNRLDFYRIRKIR